MYKHPVTKAVLSVNAEYLRVCKDLNGHNYKDMHTGRLVAGGVGGRWLSLRQPLISASFMNEVITSVAPAAHAGQTHEDH